MITQSQNSKSNIKKVTNNDLPFAPAQPVANSYIGVSTAGQTLIANLGFSVDTTNPANFQLYIDGRLQTLGSANDYTFAAIAADGTSSAINLNTSLPVNLNINAIKLGLKKESEFLTDNRFTQLYEAEGQGFQAFVNTANVLNATSTAGTPVAGTFYSTITGRAALVDFSQDLKPRMGIDRIMTQQIVQLQTEFGPNGETVFSAVNDTSGQVRFIGNWGNANDANGPHPAGNTAATDYAEITFYGTSLNILGLQYTGSLAASYSLDGGSLTSFLGSTTFSTVLATRNYDPNIVFSVVSGLLLGTHTIKIIFTTGFPNITGFEVLNPSANVITNPGVSYLSGKKQILAAQSTIAYNAAVTGTTGGRMLMYQTSAGAVAQAFQANATTPLFLTAASHTNEEIVRSYFPREFGAGRGDDFSSIGSSSSTKAFTLDDGTTTLLVSNYNAISLGAAEALASATGAGDFLSITFVGTGLDIINTRGATSTSSYTITVDGIAIQTAAAFGGSGLSNTLKICSGLPYGTHTVKFTTTTLAVTVGFSKFIVYQPKTPSLPTGAVSLGAYNVMATYVANTVAGSQNTVATGVLRKLALRESSYVGTWTIFSIDTGFNCGFNLQTTTVGSYVEYAFFGTGIEFRTFIQSSTNNFTISIDGSSNLSAYTTSYISSGGTATFTPSTGTFAGTGANQYGQGINISGLPLGLHKIRITQNTTNSIYVDAFDIITPIHSQKSNVTFDLQNTLTVGSQGIQDNRVFTPVKDLLPSGKNIAVAVSNNSAPTTSSTAAVPLQDMSLTHRNSSGKILATVQTSSIGNSSNQIIQYYLFIDGVNSQMFEARSYANSHDVVISYAIPFTVSPGIHKYDIYWATGSGTATNYQKVLSVIEL